jgi:uncharacterized damage-inducible protein DinB
MVPTTQEDNGVLVALFKHSVWANLKVLDFCEGLSEEQLGASAIGTYGSIQDTLWHMVGAEVSYVHRVIGKWPPEPPSREGFTNIAVLKKSARWTGEELLKLALAARANSMVQEESDESPVVVVRYPLASLLMQAINHATEHRAHVSTIITQLGLEPPNMDGWTYMEETGQFQETTKAGS